MLPYGGLHYEIYKNVHKILFVKIHIIKGFFFLYPDEIRL